jgi:hypothetical protein
MVNLSLSYLVSWDQNASISLDVLVNLFQVGIELTMMTGWSKMEPPEFCVTVGGFHVCVVDWQESQDEDTCDEDDDGSLEKGALLFFGPFKSTIQHEDNPRVIYTILDPLVLRSKFLMMPT